MAEDVRSVPLQPDRANESLEPWQFFVLAALVCATAVTVMVRGQGATTVILLTIIMATVALVGIAALRAVRPLVSKEEDRTSMVGERTRAALEREKLLTLRSIKELEFVLERGAKAFWLRARSLWKCSMNSGLSKTRFFETRIP